MIIPVELNYFNKVRVFVCLFVTSCLFCDVMLISCVVHNLIVTVETPNSNETFLFIARYKLQLNQMSNQVNRCRMRLTIHKFQPQTYHLLSSLTMTQIILIACPQFYWLHSSTVSETWCLRCVIQWDESTPSSMLADLYPLLMWGFGTQNVQIFELVDIDLVV